MSALTYEQLGVDQGAGAASTILPELRRAFHGFQEATSSTLIGARRPPAWLLDSVRELATARAILSNDTANAAFRWLMQLPEWARQPAIGAGDDDTVSIEWDRAGKTLHVMFDGHSAQAYFEDESANEEWEMELGHGSYALLRALKAIAA
jgi:hypothetical protein